MWQIIFFLAIFVITTVSVYVGGNRRLIPSIALGLIVAAIFLIVILPGPSLKGPGITSVFLTAILGCVAIIVTIICAYLALTAPHRNHNLVFVPTNSI